ncbi:MAG: NAD-binding protein [Candidatus Erginobacter occultus]|nr:NAD-binding protein [Candidatus Erginobacter occultus]
MNYSAKLKNTYLPLAFAVILSLNGLLAVFSALIPIIKGVFIPEIAEVTERYTLRPGDHINCGLQILLGYALIILGKGLYYRKRKTWYYSVILLAVMIASNVWISSHFNEITIAYIAVILLLLASYRIFNVRSQPDRFSYYQILVFISVVFSFLYGIVGSYLIKDQFNGLKTWGDSVYFTLITYSTIGYGDITPITQTARIFVSTMVLLGLGTFATALTVVVLPVIENKMQKVLKIVKGVRKMKNHAVLCGYNTLTRGLIEKLVARNIPFVIIDNVNQDHPVADKLGYTVVAGKATDSDILKQADLAEAVAVISLYDNDAENILTGITVNEISKEGKKPKSIILRIENEDNIPKALSIGATQVISPSRLVAEGIIEQSFK